MKLRHVILVAALVAACIQLFSPAAHARVRRSQGHSWNFYYPLPYAYERNLVKIYSGITPGMTTLEEMLQTRGYPDELINNRFFFYQWTDNTDGWRDRQDVYIEFRRSHRLGKSRYDDNGLELTAVVSRIYVYSQVRMGQYATYLDQITGITVYPHDVYYDRDTGLYTLEFPYQGYAMYFDNGSRLIGEVYFEPENYVTRTGISISSGNFNFSFTKTDELPAFLR
jgi:hypothetical protein